MALRKARGVVASSADVEAAADELLAKGNAVDGMVAGVFAACASSPGVLLGPVQILVGGAGAGLLAIDGRLRQPGLGAPRPRGFVEGEAIPEAARIGVPWLPAALSVAIATSGSATFAQVLAPAISLAKGTPRKEALSRIASQGPRALEERLFAGELLAVAGRPSGGLLTQADLATPSPTVVKATSLAVAGSDGPRRIAVLPWARIDASAPAAPAAPEEVVDVARTRVVITVDRNATFAMACWEETEGGLLVETLALRAPLAAEPVRRGQTRVKPGDARPAASPFALVGRDAPELGIAAYGAADAYDVLRDAIENALGEGRIEGRGAARVLALSHASGAATAFRS
jgi:gamma-glutamyltranspeptidase/glutathione hydrolase